MRSLEVVGWNKDSTQLFKSKNNPQQTKAVACKKYIKAQFDLNRKIVFLQYCQRVGLVRMLKSNQVLHQGWVGQDDEGNHETKEDEGGQPGAHHAAPFMRI